MNKPTLKEIEDFFKSEQPKTLPKVNFNFNNINLEKEQNNSELCHNNFCYNPKLNKTIPISNIGEFCFKQKMKEGWNFNIEFKCINRGLYFEGDAYLVKSGISTIDSKRQAMGKTLEELFINFFGNEEFHKLKGC